MRKRQRYMKKVAVTAVQLNVNTEGFHYQKWGARQRCKAGDWVVNNDGECYTIDKESFAQTYTHASPGRYYKTKEVWAEVATQTGSVTTREGSTDYDIGDYLVSNNADGSDDYAVSKTVFEKHYERIVDE